MKTFILFGSLVLAGCQLLPAGSGRIISQERTVPAFTQVDVESALHADVSVGPAQALIVSGDDNLVGYVQTRVSGGKLTIQLRDGVQGSNDDLIITVTAPAIDALTASGSAEVDAHGMAGDNLRLVSSGSSRLTAEGSADKVNAEASGASAIYARNLVAGVLSLDASGSSLGEVCATEVLDLHVSGASRALYTCNPKTVNRDLSGASSAEAE